MLKIKGATVQDEHNESDRQLVEQNDSMIFSEEFE